MQLAPSSGGALDALAVSPGAPDANKLFVGGLSQSATSEALHSYFSQFGAVTEVDVKCDPQTGRSRGFGFVAFADPICVEHALGSYTPHQIEGNWIEVKRFERPAPTLSALPEPQAGVTASKMCRHFFAGRCSYGEQCRFSHNFNAAGGEAAAGSDAGGVVSGGICHQFLQVPGGADAAAGGCAGSVLQAAPMQPAVLPTSAPPVSAQPSVMSALGNVLGTLLSSAMTAGLQGGSIAARPAPAPAPVATPALQVLPVPAAVPQPPQQPAAADGVQALAALAALAGGSSLGSAGATPGLAGGGLAVAEPNTAAAGSTAAALANVAGLLAQLAGAGGQLAAPEPTPAPPSFARPAAAVAATGGSRGSMGASACRHFLQGRCHYGDACRFPHIGGPEGTIPGHPKANTLFLGGLKRDTTEATLLTHLSQFGTVRTLEIKRDATGISRGFGFADFVEDGAADAALLVPQAHVVDGRPIEVRRHFGSTVLQSTMLTGTSTSQTFGSQALQPPLAAPVPAVAPVADNTASLARALGLLLGSSVALSSTAPATAVPAPQQAPALAPVLGGGTVVADLAQQVAALLPQQAQAATAAPTSRVGPY